MQRPIPASVSTPAPRTAALRLRARRRRWWRWWRCRRRWRGRVAAAVVVSRRRWAVRADGVLPPRERVPGRQDGGHLEIDRALVSDRRKHERLPDRRREGRPGDGD